MCAFWVRVSTVQVLTSAWKITTTLYKFPPPSSFSSSFLVKKRRAIKKRKGYPSATFAPILQFCPFSFFHFSLYPPFPLQCSCNMIFLELYGCKVSALLLWETQHLLSLTAYFSYLSSSFGIEKMTIHDNLSLKAFCTFLSMKRDITTLFWDRENDNTLRSLKAFCTFLSMKRDISTLPNLSVSLSALSPLFFPNCLHLLSFFLPHPLRDKMASEGGTHTH